jgi:hypothetical protein
MQVDTKAITHTVELTHMRQHPLLWSSLARREKEKEDAKRTTVSLTIGDFVAIGMNYAVVEHEIPVKQQHPFWVGRATAINVATGVVMVHWYHTAATKRFIDGTYRVWSVGNKLETVAMGAIWAVWSRLTDDRKIPLAARRVLKKRVANPDDEDDPYVAVDLDWIGCAGNEDSEPEDGTRHKAKGRGYGRRKKPNKNKEPIAGEDGVEDDDAEGGGSDWARAQAEFQRKMDAEQRKKEAQFKKKWDAKQRKKNRKRKRKPKTMQTIRQPSICSFTIYVLISNLYFLIPKHSLCSCVCVSVSLCLELCTYHYVSGQATI